MLFGFYIDIPLFACIASQSETAFFDGFLNRQRAGLCHDIFTVVFVVVLHLPYRIGALGHPSKLLPFLVIAV